MKIWLYTDEYKKNHVFQSKEKMVEYIETTPSWEQFMRYWFVKRLAIIEDYFEKLEGSVSFEVLEMEYERNHNVYSIFDSSDGDFMCSFDTEKELREFIKGEYEDNFDEPEEYDFLEGIDFEKDSIEDLLGKIGYYMECM